MNLAMQKTETQEQPNHLYLIDGYGFVFRAYHSLPPLTNPEGTPVGALYGFTNMIMKLKNQIRGKGGTAMLMVLDSGSKTFRNEIYSEYKANRPPAPEDLIPQFPLIKDAAEALSIPSISVPNYEADDIIATYTKQAEAQGMKVTIVSSDKDLMQLVNDNVEMYDAMKSRNVQSRQVEEKFGVTPDKVLDMLSLMGDSADNIPGVPGIGPKTAAELLNNFGDLETLLERAGEIKQNKRRESLIEFADQARLSKELAALCFDVPLDDDISHFTLQPDDPNKLLPFLQTHGFKTLASKLEAQHASDVEMLDRVAAKPKLDKKQANITAIETIAALENWLKAAHQLGNITIVPFSTKKTFAAFGLACFDINKQQTHAAIVPITESKAEQTDLFGGANDNAEPQGLGLNVAAVNDALDSYIQDPTLRKVTYDAKQLMKLLGKEISPIDDVLVMGYALDGTKVSRDLQKMIAHHLENEHALDSWIKAHKEWDEQTLKGASELLGNLAADVSQMQRIFRQRLFDEKMLNLYESLDRPAIDVLRSMEQAGIKLDNQMLNSLSEEFGTEMERLEKEIHSLAGQEFNIGSPKQLGEILFDEMGIEGGKKSGKSGNYKTDSDVLEKLAGEGHVIAEKVLKWRGLSKLKSTYTDALAKLMHPQTGRVHTTFNMALTSTGRLSSTEPNLQNIPIRTEEGRKIRTAFIADEGKLLIGADYSQIELRLLAHIAEIETLRTAFKEGKDIHAITASQVFGIPLEDMDPMRRREAKAINFGIIYGQSAFGLAASLGIPRSTAKEYIEAYFEQYPGIRKYMETTKQIAHEKGYVTTLFGRKCFLNGIDTKGPMRAFAERAAINAPLQGSAADIMKLAMVHIDRALKAKNLPAKMLLQVHDELILEVEKGAEDEVAKLLKREMENVVQVSVPLTVDASIGTHWGEIH